MKTFLFLVSFAKERNDRYPKYLKFTKNEMRELVSTYLMLILKHKRNGNPKTNPFIRPPYT